MPWLVPFCYLEIFDGPVEGVRWLGLLLGAVIALTGLLPVWFCREPAQRRRDNGLPRVRPVEMIRQAARNRPFLMLLGCSLTKMAGTSFVSSLGIYVLTYYAAHGDWKQGAILQGYVSTVYFVAAAASAPLMSALAVRFGKRGAFFVGIAAAFAGSALKWWLYAPDVGWIIVIVPLLLAPGVAGVDMLLHSMMADVCDYEQWKNGERRVGLLSAAQTWLTKTALSLSFAVAGLILNAVGFDEARALQDESTLFWLRLLFSWIPAVLMVMSALFLWRYPLSEARLKEIQAELAARETGSNANGSSHP